MFIFLEIFFRNTRDLKIGEYVSRIFRVILGNSCENLCTRNVILSRDKPR